MSNERVLTGEHGNRIREVVVFSDQALVKRRVETKADRGLNRFQVAIDAFHADPESVQAAVFGEGEIVSARLRDIPTSHRPQVDARALEEEKETLEARRDEILRRRLVVEKQLRFLDSMILFSETELPKQVRTRLPGPEELTASLRFLDQEYGALVDRDGERSRELADIDRELTTIQQRLKKQGRPTKTSKKVVEVVFDSASEQSVTIEASYVAAGAAWTPAYRVDVSSGLDDVRLTMSARIVQRTGESWDDVRLTISNAIPMKGARLPQPSSWMLRLPEPVTAFGAAKAGGGQPMIRARAASGDDDEFDALDDLADMALEEPVAAEAGFAQAETRELPLAFEYELSNGVTIPPGDDDTVLPLWTRDLESSFFHYTVPRHDPTVYLVCEAIPDRTLLDGPMSLHFAGRFVGTTQLEEKKAGDELLLNLGADRAVKVRREKLRDKISETLFGMVDRGSPSREFHYRITLENLKETPTLVRLHDATPVSATDRVEVKDVDVTPPPDSSDDLDREGVLRWDVELPPGGVREFDLKFVAKHPRGQVPVGL